MRRRSEDGEFASSVYGHDRARARSAAYVRLHPW